MRARTSVRNGTSAIASVVERRALAQHAIAPVRVEQIACAACGRCRSCTRRFFVSSCRMRISSWRFFSIRSSSSCSICLARSSFSMPLREKIRTPTTMPSMPGGQVSDASFTSPAFSPKIARSSFSSGVSWVSPFGVTLPTRMSPGLTLGADADDAALVEIAQVRLRHVRDVPRDLFRPELRVARLDLELLDVDRRVVVVLHHALGDENRVLEVVAAPRHERDEHVPAERELAQLRARTVGQHLALGHALPDADDRPLVDARVLVRALELRQAVDVGAHLARQALGLAALDAHDDALAVDEVDRARPARHDDRARIARGDVLHARADERRPRLEQRHRLALHVRSHQRAVRVVVLEERDERRGDRDELLRRDVDVVDLLARRQDEVAGLARVHALALRSSRPRRARRWPAR